ncbi:hypothetical protein P186_1779 [Pyrobaculum ferrireducens]|uniref:Uncharacterized protein n=1 Tax=Pyrobaculum ferrireducens TaxID=1104324 RepID=G7VH16_9CREN|nr:hypothetical protein P186_1779 [Pyrobaculum ferrireducens]
MSLKLTRRVEIKRAVEAKVGAEFYDKNSTVLVHLSVRWEL